MDEELWKDLLVRMAPNIACFSDSEAAPLLEQLGELEFVFWNCINWQQYPQHAHFNDSSEIIPLLEKLLRRPFDDTVYVYSPDTYLDIIKVPLRKFLEGDYLYLTPMLLWNPSEGYLIEERNIGYQTVGLIPPKGDPLAEKSLLRDSFGGGKFSSYHELILLLAHFGAHIIWGSEANNLMTKLHDALPFTPWLHIDWEKIPQKNLHIPDENQVLPILLQLFGTTLNDLEIYIQWSDQALPLIKTNLLHSLRHYRQLKAPAIETLLFNFNVGYIVELSANGTINIGLIPPRNR